MILAQADTSQTAGGPPTPERENVSSALRTRGRYQKHAGSHKAEPKKRPRVLFVNRSFWPDAEATGQLLTELCEDLAGAFEVCVIAGQPNQNLENARYRRVGEQHLGKIRVIRVWNTCFSKKSMIGRVCNMLSFLFAAARAARGLPRCEVVVVQSDPPLLCLLGWLLKRWHRGRLIVYAQDIYPEVAVALGKISNPLLVRVLERAFLHVYRQADRVVVPGEDMRSWLVERGVANDKVHCVPNWVDTRRVFPVRTQNLFRRQHDLDGRFVVMYSGNFGLSQSLEVVLEAATKLLDRPDIVFLLIGDGARRRSLEQLADRLGVRNVRFLDYQPKSQLSQSLSAANLHLVLLDPRVQHFLMPSKFYGVLASGTPAIVMASSNSELARVTRTENTGFVIPPNDPDALAETIRHCADDRERLISMGDRGRRLAIRRFDRAHSVARFSGLLSRCLV